MTRYKNKFATVKKKIKKRPTKIFKWFIWTIIFTILSGIFAIVGIYFYINKDLPRISSLSDYRPSIITTIYSDNNKKIAEFCKERRIVIALSDMPEMLIKAFVAAEDARFFQHKGIDFFGIIRAFFKNFEAGAIVQGGSTITQQVTKSFFLTPERKYARKIKEVVLAYRIDKTFTKEEILFLYLNQIYLGHAAYGVEAASENYFGKSAKDLNLAECAILAGLPQAPSRYSPFKHLSMAKQRQIYVLDRMVAEGYITKRQLKEAINQELDIKERRNLYLEKAPFYAEHIRRYVKNKYGKRILYEDGLSVYTVVDMAMQKTAHAQIEKGLRELDKRQGYRGAIKNLAPIEIEEFSKNIQNTLENNPIERGKIVQGVVIDVDNSQNTVIVRIGNAKGIIKIADMNWARKPNPEVAYYTARINHSGDALSVGDVILAKVKDMIKDAENTQYPELTLWELALEQTPKVQAALICMEAETGYIKAMVGGRDFRESQFNRAIQSRRQPGSAFKPIIYAAALDKNYTPATMIIDSPVTFKNIERDSKWKPKNYEKRFHGPTLFRDALAKSHNVITIKILQDIGVDYVINYAQKLGVTSHLSRDLSIALGSSGVSLLDAVKAYSVFDNLGYLVQPIFITKIIDRDGNIIEENEIKKDKVIEESTAYIMSSLLESVVQHGTGRRVKALNKPVAGKTGTTNNLHDAWFMGYTPRYVTGVWVGFDDDASLGKAETGSRAASPIWLGFMKQILANKPVRVFQAPEGVVFAKIDSQTGLLPIPESTKTRFECFKEGTVPTEYTKKPNAITEPEQFFKTGM